MLAATIFVAKVAWGQPFTLKDASRRAAPPQMATFAHTDRHVFGFFEDVGKFKKFSIFPKNKGPLPGELQSLKAQYSSIQEGDFLEDASLGILYKIEPRESAEDAPLGIRCEIEPSKERVEVKYISYKLDETKTNIYLRQVGEEKWEEDKRYVEGGDVSRESWKKAVMWLMKHWKLEELPSKLQEKEIHWKEKPDVSHALIRANIFLQYKNMLSVNSEHFSLLECYTDEDKIKILSALRSMKEYFKTRWVETVLTPFCGYFPFRDTFLDQLWEMYNCARITSSGT